MICLMLTAAQRHQLEWSSGIFGIWIEESESPGILEKCLASLAVASSRSPTARCQAVLAQRSCALGHEIVRATKEQKADSLLNSGKRRQEGNLRRREGSESFSE